MNEINRPYTAFSGFSQVHRDNRLDPYTAHQNCMFRVCACSEKTWELGGSGRGKRGGLLLWVQTLQGSRFSAICEACRVCRSLCTSSTLPKCRQKRNIVQYTVFVAGHSCDRRNSSPGELLDGRCYDNPGGRCACQQTDPAQTCQRLSGPPSKPQLRHNKHQQYGKHPHCKDHSIQLHPSPPALALTHPLQRLHTPARDVQSRHIALKTLNSSS
jgi:hypothetical protein